MGIQRRVTTMTMKLVAGLLVLSAFTKGDTNLPDTEELINSNEIFDVIENVIAKEDPMLQLFLRICFLHPNCYQLDIPQKRDGTKSDVVNALEKVLKKKKTETAISLLLSLIDQSQKRLMKIMFHHISQGVAEKGFTVSETRDIIDGIKDIWISVNADLEYAKSSIKELFYLISFDAAEQIDALLEIADLVQRIPESTQTRMQEVYRT